MTKGSLNLRRVTVTALCVSIALVLKVLFTVYIPIFGQNGMQVGISGIFSMLPAFLFGPIYGAASSGLVDLLGYLLKPQGAYLPLMTLAMVFGGFCRGAFWLWLRKKKSRSVCIVVILCATLLAVFGIFSMVSLAHDGVDAMYFENTTPDAISTEGFTPISKMLIERTAGMKDPVSSLKTHILLFTAAPLTAAALCVVMVLTDMWMGRHLFKHKRPTNLLQLLMAALFSGLILTTFNTVILRETIYESWKLIPFTVTWIPRAIEEVVGNAIKVYFIALLLGVIGRQSRFQEIII